MCEPTEEVHARLPYVVLGKAAKCQEPQLAYTDLGHTCACAFAGGEAFCACEEDYIGECHHAWCAIR